MSSYTENDLEESLKLVGIEPKDIEEVCAGWGNVDDDGKCCEECGGEWTGGFLLKMNDGRYAYVSGWCDYTGWGCQDGADVEYFDHKPSPSEMKQPWGWDSNPADLNKWLLTAKANP